MNWCHKRVQKPPWPRASLLWTVRGHSLPSPGRTRVRFEVVSPSLQIRLLRVPVRRGSRTPRDHRQLRVSHPEPSADNKILQARLLRYWVKTAYLAWLDLLRRAGEARKIDERSGNVYENKGRGQKVEKLEPRESKAAWRVGDDLKVVAARFKTLDTFGPVRLECKCGPKPSERIPEDRPSMC